MFYSIHKINNCVKVYTFITPVVGIELNKNNNTSLYFCSHHLLETFWWILSPNLLYQKLKRYSDFQPNIMYQILFIILDR